MGMTSPLPQKKNLLTINSMPYLEQKLEDHCRIDVLFCDRGQPQVRPLDVEERGPSDVSHRRPNLKWGFSNTADQTLNGFLVKPATEP